MLVVMMLVVPVIQAADAGNGKKLYDAKCFRCHDTKIHTRTDRIIHTYTDLVNRVKFCDAQTEAGFTAQQRDDVTEYLNNTFYKYPRN